MKRVFIYLSLVIALFPGCEEVPPFIDFSEPGKVTDTNYIVTPVPPPQNKIVLIEDITGVRCVNCPTAAAKIKEIINSKSEDSVIAIALYPWPVFGSNSLSNNTIPYDGFPKLASDTSSQIVESLGIPQGLPSAYVDRHIFAPQTSKPISSIGVMASLVDQRVRLTTPVNIVLKKAVAGRKITLDIKLQYTETVVGNHKYAIYLTEDNIISRQAFPTGVVDNYVHNHALKVSLDLPTGRPLTASLVPGRTFDKRYEYEVSPSINLANCHIICVITDAATGDVVNVRKIALQ